MMCTELRIQHLERVSTLTVSDKIMCPVCPHYTLTLSLADYNKSESASSLSFGQTTLAPVG